MREIKFLSKHNPEGVSIESCDMKPVRYKDTGIWVCSSEHMSELAREEAHHHDHDDQDPLDVHQLESWRNIYYHSLIWNNIKTLPKGQHLLEIGAGSGYDAAQFLPDYHMVLTDVSPETLVRLKDRLHDNDTAMLSEPMYMACDGEHLPFANQQFDGVYMVATFHHFSNYVQAVDEVARVLRPGGLLVLGIEPNKTYFKPLQWFQRFLYRITGTDPHHISKADAQMQGFTKGEFELLFGGDKWCELDVRPMWFLAGWVHYILEFVYRTFKLKKRIKLPLSLEKGLVSFDEFLFSIPGLKFFCWHWIVNVKKK
ncbi:MAG: hypothetical protein COU68_01495 [Candidatus Pacebacteria bacterium CG10_big_fil_rev_8_21_14_0_10_45_6]|nr:MAG: hypothetical protein COU68_01495 [Candidatus Pacebacteria bacterium CG10_big_fil_rev_8_21_14_0_10_45_6]